MMLLWSLIGLLHLLQSAMARIEVPKAPRISLVPPPVPEPLFSSNGSRTLIMQHYPRQQPLSDEDLLEPFTVQQTHADELPDLAPAGRWMHSMEIVGNHIFMYGGIASYSTSLLNDVWIRNWLVKRWDVLQHSFAPPAPDAGIPSSPGLFSGDIQSPMISPEHAFRPSNIPRPPPMRSSPFNGLRKRIRSRTNHFNSPLSDSSFVSGDMWSYDLNLHVWNYVGFDSQADSLPPARYGHSSCVIKNEVVIFGGVSWNGELLSDVWAFNPNTLQWAEIHSSSKVIPRMGHSAVTSGTKMIVFGGATYGTVPLNYVQEFETSTGAWNLVKVSGAEPAPRWLHSSQLWGTSILVFGGITLSNVRLDDVWVYSIDGKKWSQPDLQGSGPMPRSLAASAMIGNSLFVFGGNGGNVALGDLWECRLADTSSGQWEELIPFDIHPLSRQGASMVTLTPPAPIVALETKPEPEPKEPEDDTSLRNPFDKHLHFRRPEKVRKSNAPNRYLFLFGGAPAQMLE